MLELVLSRLSVLIAGGTDAEHLSDRSRVLADHRGKNIILQPKVLWEFADRFLDALFDPDLLEKVSGKVSISITQVRPFKSSLWMTFKTSRSPSSNPSKLSHSIIQASNTSLSWTSLYGWRLNLQHPQCFCKQLQHYTFFL